MPTKSIYFLALMQAGGNKLRDGEIGHHAGVILFIVVAVLAGVMLLALLLAGRKRR